MMVCIREFSPEGQSDHDTSYTCLELSPRKKKIKNKKRFSDEQIKSLESIFVTEAKLEPKKKLHIARELELTPRQVAIWFQNKRARWKSKQIEQEYRRLRANYDNLASRYDSLTKEKQSLLVQLQNLREVIGNRQEKEGTSKATEAITSSEGGTTSDHGQEKQEPSPSNEVIKTLNSNISHDNIMEQLGDERRRDFVDMNNKKNIIELVEEEYIDKSLVAPSPEKWFSFVSDGPSNTAPFTNPQYWLNNFWT